MKKKLLSTLVAFVLPLVIWSNMAFAADYYPTNTILSEGTQSSQVVELQKALNKLGYLSYKPTGYFGPLTRQAVIVYQKNNSLMADGIVGSQTARELKVDTIISTAKQYMGVPYVWGGTSPSGFDCSGFTQYVFAKNGVTIPRTASLQYSMGTPVSKANLKPGDLVFFTTYKPGPSHLGIYAGNNQFIHASTSKGVTISSLDNPYYAPRYIGARRVLK